VSKKPVGENVVSCCLGIRTSHEKLPEVGHVEQSSSVTRRKAFSSNLKLEVNRYKNAFRHLKNFKFERKYLYQNKPIKRIIFKETVVFLLKVKKILRLLHSL
jgi:hypothetical protein